MLDESFFRFLKIFEGVGLWLSIVAWFTVAGGAIVMFLPLRKVKRKSILISGAIVAAVVLAGNLADYFVTLHRSPDLALEANPLWRNVVDQLGLGIAKWYGLTGKIFVSILAGQMFAFYLANRERLFPVRAGTLREFLMRMGERSGNLRERFLALFTMFAFLFAFVQFLYFYIAGLNWITDADLLACFPPISLTVVCFVGLVFLAFVTITFQAYRNSSGTAIDS